MLASWSHEGVVFSSYHVFSPPLSGLNWRSLTPPGGPGPFTFKMATLLIRSAHAPLLGPRTLRINTLGFFKRDTFNPKPGGYLNWHYHAARSRIWLLVSKSFRGCSRKIRYIYLYNIYNIIYNMQRWASLIFLESANLFWSLLNTNPLSFQEWRSTNR